MKNNSNYLFVLCALFCLYSCNDNIEELNPIEKSPFTGINSRSTVEKITCGTIASEPPAWYFGAQARALNDNICTLNVFVHVIRSSGGVGFNKESVSQTVINKLNSYYSAAKINFFLTGNEYIDSDWYNNSDKSYCKEICTQNSHANAIDIYVLSSGAGWDVAGKAEQIISSACVIQSYYYEKLSVAHEVGHCLGLYHTHHGTYIKEGGTPELVDGSNSAIAGDYMTDTPADPNEWNFIGEYMGTNTDANGDYYHPDPTNLMSYSWAYNQNIFTPEQIAKMRGIILQSDIVNKTIHQKQIIGLKHFSRTANYSLDILNTDESVTWKVTAYSLGKSTNATYTTSTLTLSSTESTYYEIVAQIISPNGSKSVVFFATCNAPSPYIGNLYWESNTGQYSITNATEYGNTLYVSGNLTLTMEYTDKAENNSHTLSDFEFTCVTAANRVLRGSTFSLTPNDCVANLMIRTKDACGTSDDFFTIPCELTNYYYNVDVTSDKIVVNTITVDNEEINAILAARNVSDINDNKHSGIKSVLVYTENQQLVNSTKNAIGAATIQIVTDSWDAGMYYLSISDGKNVQHRKVIIQ